MTFRLGLVGFGDHALQVHVHLLTTLRGVALVGIAETDDARREQARTRVPAAAVFSDYGELLEMPGLDAIVICVPSCLHAKPLSPPCKNTSPSTWRNRWRWI